jgi:hypothetical protein
MRSDRSNPRSLVSVSRIGRSLIVLIALIGFLSCGDPKKNAAEGGLTLYTAEQAAQQHCPDDTVVWLNLPTGIFHFQGQRWYGNTKTGEYVCEKEAEKAGDRATLNGQ